MKLSESQLELLKKTRTLFLKTIESGGDYAAPYICWHIWIAESGRNFFPHDEAFEVLVKRSSFDVQALIEGIENALLKDDAEQLSELIDGTYPSITCHRRYAYSLGRLAWLDKMIDTGEIK